MTPVVILVIFGDVIMGKSSQSVTECHKLFKNLGNSVFWF